MGIKLKYSTTCHSQTNSQTEVTHRTFSTILRAFIKLNAKAWDLLLPNAEFAYNKAPSRTTGVSPFKVVYGFDPLWPLDLVPKNSEEKPSVEANKRVEKSRSSTSKSWPELRNQIPSIKFKQTSIKGRWYLS